MYQDDLKLLTITELAQLTGMKKSFLRCLVFQRRIPFFKIGRRVLFRFHEIDSWIKSQKNNVLISGKGGLND